MGHLLLISISLLYLRILAMHFTINNHMVFVNHKVFITLNIPILLHVRHRQQGQGRLIAAISKTNQDVGCLLSKKSRRMCFKRALKRKQNYIIYLTKHSSP